VLVEEVEVEFFRQLLMSMVELIGLFVRIGVVAGTHDPQSQIA
jgi:hypothetical protein